MAEKCPHHLVEIVDGECPRCSWKPPVKGRRDRRAASGGNDGGCDFWMNGSRCTFAGTFSPNIREGGPWYCRYHGQDGNRAQDAAQHEFFRLFVWHESAEKHRRERLQDWYPEVGRREAEFQNRLAENPDWKRKPGETRSEYGARMRTLARSLMGGRILEADRLREREEAA